MKLIRQLFLAALMITALMVLAIASGNAYAASKPVQITVIGGDEGQGGSHMGSFDAMYSGKKLRCFTPILQSQSG